ncbi:expressed unknown protein [Seminavis robusta]|uniref:Uncharacterized protein n=1 Tax=Seminavis robusta TaxID=568900 RepID=A0A9N8EFQ2_9STRA|nr:expressed unknown protein [Seminavis robusta]|eukprot:Sro1119_g243260.1 n/a (793) ;mRNA; r:29500-31878
MSSNTNRVFVFVIMVLIAVSTAWDLIRERLVMVSLDIASTVELERNISVTPKNHSIAIKASFSNSSSSNSTSTVQSSRASKDPFAIVRDGKVIHMAASTQQQTQQRSGVTVENGQPPLLLPDSNATDSNLTTQDSKFQLVEPTTPSSDKSQDTPEQPPIPSNQAAAADTTNHDDVFDPNLLPDDYIFLDPSIPSKEWMHNCAKTLQQDSNILKPFPITIPGYSLGDCITHCNQCTIDNKQNSNSNNRTIAFYYNAFACPNNKQNLTVVDRILKIVGQREGFVKPDPNDIVIHLPLGDGVDTITDSSVGDLLTQGAVESDQPEAKNAKLKTLRSLYDYLEELSQHPDAKLVFVGGGSHNKPELFEKARVYANCLQRGLAKAGRVVELHLDSGDADKDFYFMSYAKKLVLSSADYSRIAGAMALRHGGEIVGNQFDIAEAGLDITPVQQQEVQQEQSTVDEPTEQQPLEQQPQQQPAGQQPVEQQQPAAQNQSSHPANPPISSDAAGPNSEDVFDPKLTLEDYERMKHSPPSKEWLRSCASTLETDDTIVKPFPTLRPDYALGDCIKKCNKCNLGLPGRQRKIFAPNFKRDKNFNLTIAGYYSELACPFNTANYTIVDQVLEIFGQREGFIKPDPNDIIIHLRLGDVVDYTGEDVGTLLIKGGIGNHPGAKKRRVRSVRSVYGYLDDLKNYSDAKVVIVGGSHKPHVFKKSRVYANCLQRGLAKAGRVVELQLDNGDADKDFYFMSYAKRYMLSTGGFSRFIGGMAILHGGQLIGNMLDFEDSLPNWDFIKRQP